jgi:hypothetical protein
MNTNFMNEPLLKGSQFLGLLCKRGHEFENTGQSLRRPNGSPAGVCVKCLSLYQQNYRLGKKQEIETYLGHPCPNGHIEEGQSRRYVSTGTCVQCQKIHSLKYRRKRNEN